MSNYLYQKYYGVYRVLVPIDQTTNDFPRTPDGKLDTEDFYIPCRKAGREIAQISHYGRNTLDVLVFSIYTGRKTVKLCQENNIPVSDVKEGDGELSFRFSADHMEFVADYLGAMTKGKDIRPFSTKNLPKADYKIPPEELARYSAIIAYIPKKDMLEVSRITEDFLAKKFKSNPNKHGKTVEQELRFYKMSRMRKEYIHMKGVWDEYLEYLKEGLE